VLAAPHRLQAAASDFRQSKGGLMYAIPFK